MIVTYFSKRLCLLKNALLELCRSRTERQQRQTAFELLSELMDYLERVFESFPIVTHPLQPFSRNDYFKSETEHVSYAKHWYTALQDATDATLFTDLCINPFQIDPMVSYVSMN